MLGFTIQKRIRRTTYIIIFLAAILCGLFIAKFTEPLSVSWLLLIIVLAPLLMKRGVIFICYLLLAGVLFGWWRGGVLQAHDALYNQYYYQTVTVTARSTEDSFYAINGNGQLEFTAESITINGQRLPGKVRVRGFGEPMVYRHDIITAHGKLYPTLGGKQAVMSYADLDVIARAQSLLENFRRNFIAGMETALPEPAASFGIGLLVGQRSLLPVDIAAVLVTVGLTHIVAVSGYNLTIIVRGVQKGLRKLSRFQILAISLTLIYIFLLITGFSPSIVRAAIVAGLGLGAWYFGRTFRPLLLILLAAVITGFANPYYIWGDIGWYLSFLAFFGVLILAPLISIRLFKKTDSPLWASVAIESFAAQIMTLPLIMLIFGRISLIGFVANIIVVPMVPLAMLFSVIAGIAGMVVPALSGWIALPARLWLDVMLFIATLLSKIPGAQARTSVTVGGLVMLYGIILVFIIGLKKRALSVKIKSRTELTNEV